MAGDGHAGTPTDWNGELRHGFWLTEVSASITDLFHKHVVSLHKHGIVPENT